MLRCSELGLLRAVLFAFALIATSACAAEGIEEKAKLCATCHGEKGVPITTTTPVIWGQNEGYLYLQLRDFKSGARKNPLMGPVAATLEKQDMKELAAYFTKLKWPDLGQPQAPGDVTAKAESAASSIGCRGCHLDHFQGDGTTARLAGQWQEYLHRPMMAFRDGSRGNNPGMSDLMKASLAGRSRRRCRNISPAFRSTQYLGNGR